MDDQEGRLKTQVLAVGQKKMGRRETKEKGKEHSVGQRRRAGHSPSTCETMSVADGQKVGRLAPHTNSSGGKSSRPRSAKMMTAQHDADDRTAAAAQFLIGVGREEGRLLGRLDAAPVRVVGHEEGRHDEEHDDDHEGGPPRAGRKNSNDSPGEGGARRAAPPLPPARTRASRGGEILFPKALSSAVKK